MLSDIPGLKELLGDGSITPNPDGLTVLEIANRVGNFFGVPPEIFDAIAVIDKVNDIANLLTGASLNNQLNLPLGDFNLLQSLNGQGRDIRQPGSLTDLQLPTFDASVITDIENQARDLVKDTPLKGVVNKLLDPVNKALSYAGLVPDQYDLQFPVLDDPSILFGLLIGQDVPLFQWDLPPFVLDTNLINQTVPLLGPLNAGLFGSLRISGDFAFGYDTYGLKSVRAASRQARIVCRRVLDQRYRRDRSDAARHSRADDFGRGRREGRADVAGRRVRRRGRRVREPRR